MQVMFSVVFTTNSGSTRTEPEYRSNIEGGSKNPLPNVY